jgi:hypothetical protein
VENPAQGIEYPFSGRFILKKPPCPEGRAKELSYTPLLRH